MKILIEISPGELIDRLSILQVKKIKIHDQDKLKNIYFELDKIWEIFLEFTASLSDELNLAVYKAYDQLSLVNTNIWNLEDRLREVDAALFKGDAAYYGCKIAEMNDKRATLKKEVNILLGSTLVEEKSHENL